MRNHLLILAALLLLVSPQLGLAAQAAETVPQALDDAHDIPQMPGFPVEIGPHQPSPSYRGVTLADIDNDGDLELLYAHYACTELGLCLHGQISGWDHLGNILPGFPIPLEGVWTESPLAVGDLDGDGDQEIVLMAFAPETDQSILFAFDHQGFALPGFPVTTEISYGFVALNDINLDGYPEILFTTMSGIQAVARDGSPLSDGWPLDLMAITGGIEHGINGPLSVADVDGDGRPEIGLLIGDDSLFLLTNDGTVVPGWPQTYSPQSSILGNCVVFADLDGDVDLEVIFVRNVEGASIANEEQKVEVWVYHHNGQLLPGWPQEILPELGGAAWLVSLPAIADLEGDGELDIIVAASHNPRASTGNYGHGARVFAWDLHGSLKQGFPYRPHANWRTGAITMITAVDSDGDGKMELYADAAHSDDDLGYILGIDWRGRNLQGFPLRPLGSTFLSGVIIDDVDADGDYEMAVNGMTFRDPYGYMLRLHLYDLPSAYSSKDMSWPTYHADNQRDGHLKRRYKDWRFVNAGTRMGGGR